MKTIRLKPGAVVGQMTSFLLAAGDWVFNEHGAQIYVASGDCTVVVMQQYGEGWCLSGTRPGHHRDEVKELLRYATARELAVGA